MRLLFAMCLFLAVCGFSTAEDWTTHKFNNARTGSTPEQLKTPFRAGWVYTAPAAPKTAWAGPDKRTIEGHKLRHRVNYDDTFQVCVVGNRVFFGSSVDHQVHCLDRKTGKEYWHFFTGAPVRLAPTYWEGQLFFGSDDGYVYSVDAKTGKQLWQLRAGPADEWFLGRGDMISRWPIRTGITVHDGTAFFAAGLFPHEDIFLYAVNARSGKIEWMRDNISATDAGRNSISPQGYLLANEKYLFVPSGRSLPACFDRKTGELVHHRTHSWRSSAGGVVGGTRAFLADGQIYAAGEHHMLAMDQKTGNVGYAYIEGKQVAIDGDEAYTITGDIIARLDRKVYSKASVVMLTIRAALYALERKMRSEGKNVSKTTKAKHADKMKEFTGMKAKGLVWKAVSPLQSSLLVTGNLVISGGENKVEARNKKDGKLVWEQKVEGDVRGLAAANGTLFVSTTKGKIYTFFSDDQPDEMKFAQPTPVKMPYPESDLLSKAAENILKQSNIKKGFCLVIGAEQGQLAFELAKRSGLLIYGIEPDADKVEKGRELLSRAGYYGHRVVLHQADLGDIPYSNYFADLIVSESYVRTGKLPGVPTNFTRHVKPLGGTVYFAGAAKTNGKAEQDYVDELAFEQTGKTKKLDNGAMFVRGKLRGADNWTHQYGSPSNVASNNDQLVKGGLGVLWYGDPGPGKMVNRHEGAVGPVSVNGKLIVQGQFAVMAYDAYNGTFLWEYENPQTFRTGVFQNYNASNLLTSDEAVFIMEGNEVVQLNLETGKLEARHKLPEDKQKTYQWGYVAYQDGKLFGTATIRKELANYLRRRGRKFEENSDAIFAIDVKTGKHDWTYQGKNIESATIALGPDRVYFIDSSISSEERSALLRQDMTELKKLKGKEAEKMAQRLKKYDARLAVALDMKTGNKLWSKAVDVTDCSDIGAGGGKLTLMFHDDVLVICGANANGHYWRQFVSGEFKRRRIVALSAKDGKKLWSKDANYRHRPIIIGSKIIAEPWALELASGKHIMRKHPVTGKEVPWSMYRPGHHCGMLTGTPNMLMFRSGFTGFYDLYNDSGTQHFAGHRLGCWINAIPANGLVMIPEASAGCVCQFSIASTITLEPREARQPWSIYSSVGKVTPVQHLAINFGAPGDRKDKSGTVWFSHPRPNPYREVGLDVKLDVSHTFVKGGEFKSVNSKWNAPETLVAPSWVFTSWGNGLNKVELPLLGKEDKPGTYTVRLFFADLSEDAKPGQRVFDIKIQGKTVAKNFDLLADGDKAKAVSREFTDVAVTRNLVVELVPQDAAADRMPLLSGMEIVREEGE